LFDYLAAVIPGSRVLDLYAGSGGLGLEAVSRGAELALFVDAARSSIEVARENARALGFLDRCRFIRDDVFRFLNRCREAPVGRFDVVFAAPPYRIAQPDRMLAAVDLSEILEPSGVVCLEFARHTAGPQPDDRRFSLARRRVYGETVLEVWDHRPPGDAAAAGG